MFVISQKYIALRLRAVDAGRSYTPPRARCSSGNQCNRIRLFRFLLKHDEFQLHNGYLEQAEESARVCINHAYII